MVRSWPNIALTGTPGTGKSSHAQLIIDEIPTMRHIDMGPIVKENGFHTGYDEDYLTYDVDEDALLDYIEPLTGTIAPEPVVDEQEDSSNTEKKGTLQVSDDISDDRGGLVLDWHCCEAYPERWIDLVVVLRCNHELLWKRLEKRNYPLAKIQDNNECEIMEVVLAEAREAYPDEAIVVLQSENNADVESNVARIVEWIHAWRVARGLDSLQATEFLSPGQTNVTTM